MTEEIIYILIYLIKGKLSWEVLKTKSKERKSGKNKLKKFLYYFM